MPSLGPWDPLRHLTYGPSVLHTAQSHHKLCGVCEAQGMTQTLGSSYLGLTSSFDTKELMNLGKYHDYTVPCTYVPLRKIQLF
jgi:hypothetical protein